MPQLQLSMEVMDLDICHFVQYKPHNSDFDPMQMEVTIVHRDKMWFEKNLPLMQKFISDLDMFREQYQTYLKEILPVEQEERQHTKKRKFEACLIQDYEEMKNTPVNNQYLEM